MQRIQSGVTDQYVYFMLVDATDLKTPETGIASITVYRSRNGGAATVYTTPIFAELSAANMPGWYRLLVDEDTTIDAGDAAQNMALHITATGCAPARIVIELFRPPVSAGETLTVASGIGTVNTTQFGGTNLTQTGGRPEVNTTHAAGTAWNSGAITANTLAAGAITAAKFAANALDAVWSTATRLLTAGTNIVLAKGTGVTGFNDLSAAAVNAEVDTALADYDAPTKAEMDGGFATVVANQTTINNNVLDIPNNAEFAAAMNVIDADFTATNALITGLNNPSASAIASAVHNFMVESTFTFQDVTRLSAAALLGEVLGAQTAAPITFKGLDGTSTRITMTGDQYGNRSNPIYNAEDA